MRPSARRSTLHAGLAGLLAAVAAALVSTAPAAAEPAPAARGAASGGAEYVATPRVSRVTCVAACGTGRAARAGSRIRLRGADLGGATRVVFLGGRGGRDDARVAVRGSQPGRLDVRVPAAARSGPLRVEAGRAAKSRLTRSLRILAPAALAPPAPTGELTPVPGPRDPDGPLLETAISSRKALLEGSDVTLSYRVSDDGPVAVKVDVVRVSDGAVAASWSQTATPGQVATVSFGAASGGTVQPEGRYAFRVEARDQAGAQARSARTSDEQRDAFDVQHHIFPVRGRHSYGEAGARFGSGRAGHSHQGQDVFAACGTRMVAARGGTVQFKQYHAAAGHYIVIDGGRTGVDYAYMHLTAASPFKVGDRVRTGQDIGTVGDTGNASGCHLHFEMWGEPGWYDGGAPFDPLPALLAWDRQG